MLLSFRELSLLTLTLLVVRLLLADDAQHASASYNLAVFTPLAN